MPRAVINPFPVIIIALTCSLGLAIGNLTRDVSAFERVRAGIRDANEAFADGFLAGCGVRHCRITYNPGGRLADYEALARAVIDRGAIVIVAGDCYSACVLMADKARDRVFITPAARFHFHRASDESLPPMSPDLTDWVIRHGGFPSNASREFTTMTFAAAQTFWQVARPAPSGRQFWPPKAISEAHP